MYDQKDLITLIKSRTPIIVVETSDEQRILSLIGNAAAKTGQNTTRWTITGGLVAGLNNFAAAGASLEPTEFLLTIWNTKTAGIYVLVDFHPFMTEPRNVRSSRKSRRGQRGTGRYSCSSATSSISRMNCSLHCAL